MSTQIFQDKDFINGLSKKIVVEFAPEEIDMFDELAQEYYQDPTPPDASKQTDTPLGFGVNIAFSIMTPAAIAMATTALNFVMASAVEAIKNESYERIQEKVKSLFNIIDNKDKQESVSIFQISPEEFEELKHLAVREAQRYGFTNEAEQMADELIRPLRLNLS